MKNACEVLNFKVLIIDQEQSIRVFLEETFNSSFPGLFSVASENTVQGALEQAIRHDPELIFANHQIQDTDMILALNTLEAKPQFVIAMVTDQNQALKALKSGAFDCLVKPLESKDVKEVITRAISKYRIHRVHRAFIYGPTATIVLHGHHTEVIRTNSILYVAAKGKRSTFYLHDGSKKVSTKNLEWYWKKLSGSLFFRIHDNYLVNLHQVSHIETTMPLTCVLKNGTRLDTSDLELNRLRTLLGIA